MITVLSYVYVVIAVAVATTMIQNLEPGPGLAVFLAIIAFIWPVSLPILWIAGKLI